MVGWCGAFHNGLMDSQAIQDSKFKIFQSIPYSVVCVPTDRNNLSYVRGL